MVALLNVPFDYFICSHYTFGHYTEFYLNFIEYKVVFEKARVLFLTSVIVEFV